MMLWLAISVCMWYLDDTTYVSVLIHQPCNSRVRSSYCLYVYMYVKITLLTEWIFRNDQSKQEPLTEFISSALSLFIWDLG